LIYGKQSTSYGSEKKMSEDTVRALSAESCLLEDQSGLTENERRPLSIEEAQASVVRMDTDVSVLGMGAPPIYRTYQARAATTRKRTNADINAIVLHTPEGGTPGTLSVLNGTGAGFDWFLPPSGELYKCNDYRNHIAWQAGDWPFNQRSIGIEQWDFAARMHLAPESHYDRLARLCAFLVEDLDLAIRAAKGYSDYGFIYHRVVTPGRRCDPDNCGKSRFDMDQLLQKTSDLVKGRSAPEPPPPGEAPDKGGKRAKYGLTGLARHDRAKVKAFLKSKGAPEDWVEPVVNELYRLTGVARREFPNLADKVVAPDAAALQSALETGFGKYGGASRRWNLAGIKHGRAKGDAPEDFEVPMTPTNGVWLYLNHMHVYTSGPLMGYRHSRYFVAKDARAGKPLAKTFDDLAGTWAADPNYGTKLKKLADELEAS